MAVKLTSTSIWSQDLNNVLPFYRDVLGMPVRMETPRYVQLGEPADPPLALGSHSDVHGKATDPARHIVAGPNFFGAIAIAIGLRDRRLLVGGGAGAAIIIARILL